MNNDQKIVSPWVNLEEHDINVETVRYSPVNLVGQGSTKRTINSTVQYDFKFSSIYSDVNFLSGL